MKMMKMLKLSCAAVIAMALGADGARRNVNAEALDNCERQMSKNMRFIEKGTWPQVTRRKQLHG